MDEEVEEILARSKALNQEKRYRESEELMRTAMTRFPSCQEVLLQAAATFLLTAPEATATLAHRAVQTSPDDPAVLFRAAHVLFAADEFDASRDYLARVRPLITSEFPLVIDVVHLAGKLAFQAGDLDQAETGLAMAFERAPESIGHGEVLAQLLRQQGKRELAREVVRRARVYRPHDTRLIALERQLSEER